jgi:hypothetical protein
VDCCGNEKEIVMAKTSEGERTVRVRINYVNPPHLADKTMEFGLQDKDRRLYPSAPQADGSLRFECDLRVRRAEDGKPNFLGTFPHGTPTDRFLYVTMKQQGAIQWRSKIKLASITWAQVEQASEGGLLEASVERRGTASAPLLGAGWQVVSS